MANKDMGGTSQASPRDSMERDEPNKEDVRGRADEMEDASEGDEFDDMEDVDEQDEEDEDNI